MNSIFLLLAGLGCMAAGFFIYSRFISEKIFQLDGNYQTPAHTQQDGIDYVPTNKYILWGHHFTSVAGAAPIIGPAIAVIWGWLPAFLWVALGTVFMAGVHDMSAIWASVRNRGQSMGFIVGNVIGGRARALLMVVIFLLLLMVNTAFGTVIAFSAAADGKYCLWYGYRQNDGQDPVIGTAGLGGISGGFCYWSGYLSF